MRTTSWSGRRSTDIVGGWPSFRIGDIQSAELLCRWDVGGFPRRSKEVEDSFLLSRFRLSVVP